MTSQGEKYRIIRTDVLCVGGGIAGLMASIRARELGAKVVIAEKGHAKCSGRGRSGNDHFWCYIPEIHGSDMDAFLKESVKGPKMKIIQTGTSISVLRTFLERSFNIVKLWDSWGIPMKYNGRWEFAGHAFPGEILTHLKYSGKNQKTILYQTAKEKGVEIINRVMVIDLLSCDNCIVGAIGIDTRAGNIYVFAAKSIILGTGNVDRLYPPPFPGYQASSHSWATMTGDGRSMAYRAGAALANMEYFRRGIGPRYFGRAGQSTWVGVLKDTSNRPIGPFITKPDRKYHDMTMEANSSIIEEYHKSGKGPVYMDCTGISDEDHSYMMHWFENEGMEPLIRYMKEEGVDLRRNPIEFGTYHPQTVGKIWVTKHAETSMPGLFAAGDESMGSIGPAATYGWIAGESAANYTNNKADTCMEQCEEHIEKWAKRVQEIRQRKEGPDWREANITLQRLMLDYAGLSRSESMLTAGLQHLERLKAKVAATLVARNSWELTRCLETINLIDLGELLFIAALERKETRGIHKRTDYPLTNSMLDDKVLFIKNIDGKPTPEWRKAE